MYISISGSVDAVYSKDEGFWYLQKGMQVSVETFDSYKQALEAFRLGAIHWEDL